MNLLTRVLTLLCLVLLAGSVNLLPAQEGTTTVRLSNPAGQFSAASGDDDTRSGAFVPYFCDGFEDYADESSLSGGKPFGAAGRTAASSEQAHRGRHSARMAIQRDDKGGFGRWGGILPIKPALPRGREIWERLTKTGNCCHMKTCSQLRGIRALVLSRPVNCSIPMRMKSSKAHCIWSGYSSS